MGETKRPDLDEAELIARYSVLLENVFEELFATLEVLKQEVQGLTLSTKKRPDDILSMLPHFLPLQQMSLLEVQYVLPGTTKRPGIRFWFEGPKTGKCLRAVLFPDTRVWEVSDDLTKLSTELGTFRLEGTSILAEVSSVVSSPEEGGSDWRAALRAVLRTPILFPHT